MDYQSWLKLGDVINFIGIIDIAIVFILLAVQAIEVDTALLVGLLTGLIPITYSEFVFRIGAILTGQAIDMSFYITDPLGEPIDGLNITAEPLDNIFLYKYPIFIASQKDINNHSGWYYIPSRHSAPMVDVPPGYHSIKINWEEEDCYEEFKTKPIPMGERYSENITLARNHPYIMSHYPLENENGVDIKPLYKVEIVDFQNDMLESIIFSENFNGNWEEIRKIEEESSGNFTAKSICACEYNKEYSWKIDVVDIHGNRYNETYGYITSPPPKNQPPLISGEFPKDGATNVPIDTTQLKVYLYDEDGDLLDWSIESTPDIGRNSDSDDVNGLKTCEIYNLDFSTTYQWHIIVDDGVNTPVTEDFHFTTQNRE